MKSDKRTITTFLLSKNPNGIKKIWDEMGQTQCIYFTRTELHKASERDELSQPALYMLIGEDKEIYIGETENFKKRIVDHNKNKDFWGEVLVFTSRNNALSKSEVQYLEAVSVEKIKQVSNYSLKENKQSPKKPTLVENREEIAKDYFCEIRFLANFLGYDMFKNYDITPVENLNQTALNTQNDTPEKTIWLLEAKDISAKAIYEGNKMVVLKGSIAVKNVTATYGRGKVQAKDNREKTLQNKATEKNNFYTLTENIEFQSPSGAASFCLGRPTNGWVDWKNKDGKTIDEIIRQKN